MDGRGFREAAHATVEDIIKYNATLEDRLVLAQIRPGYLKDLIPSKAPDHPEPWSSIQQDVADKIIPGLTHWQSPNFMAFFPANVTYPSLLGEMYSAAFNAPGFNWLCSPACTELETIVMDWVAKALKLPDCFLSTSSGVGGGVIHGSTSEAVITAMVAARERYLRMKADAECLEQGSIERGDRIAFLRGRMVALSSDQAHSSTQKGAMIAGTGYRSISTALSGGFCLTALRLHEALERCYADRLEPYYITLSFGTTNTCAVDDFAAIAKLRAKYPTLWIHIDAAYAGAALILPRYQDQYCTDIGKVADSFNFNMHKWLLVNFDASCFFVRNRNHLIEALSVKPAYLQNSFTDAGLVTDYRDWQIPFGRRFRALKIWFVMRTYGVEGMRRHIEDSIKIGESFAAMVLEREDLFELVAEPKFALTCLRVKPEVAGAVRVTKPVNRERISGSLYATRVHQEQAGGNEARTTTKVPTTPKEEITPTEPEAGEAGEADPSTQANQLTRQVAELINSRAEIFITASTTAGKTFIRVVGGSPNATVEHAKNAFRIIVETTEEVLGFSPSGERIGKSD